MESTIKGAVNFVKSFSQTKYTIVGKENSRSSINWNGNPLCLRRASTTQFLAMVMVNILIYSIKFMLVAISKFSILFI